MRTALPGVRIHKVTNDRIYAYCPFHKGGRETRPALVVYLDSARWRCHACGERGTVTELMARLGLQDFEAERINADVRSMHGGSTKRKPTEHPVCPEYHLGPFNRRPLNLIRDGFSRGILDEMEVGFDTGRSRVIYPVRSPKGQLHGVVGGAVFPETSPDYQTHYGSEAKYIAYGTSQGFPFQLDPKWSLWNYHRVRTIESPEPVVVVEGFKALMWVKMAGIRKVVAACGTSFEEGQVILLARLGGPQYLLFLDNDKAGRLAATKLKAALREMRPDVHTVKYPRDVRQPDNLDLDEVRKCLLLEVEEGRVNAAEGE